MLGLGFCACLALAAAPRPRLMWNATASVPIGLYRLSEPGRVVVGDLVVVRPGPGLAAALAERGWLPRGVPLVKPVAAVAGQTACRSGPDVTIDERRVARAKAADGHGRPLPRWSGCRRLETGEVLVLASPPGSVDGRYFGVTVRGDILARAHPLWIPSEAAP